MTSESRSIRTCGAGWVSLGLGKEDTELPRPHRFKNAFSKKVDNFKAAVALHFS